MKLFRKLLTTSAVVAFAATALPARAACTIGSATILVCQHARDGCQVLANAHEIDISGLLGSPKGVQAAWYQYTGRNPGQGIQQAGPAAVDIWADGDRIMIFSCILDCGQNPNTPTTGMLLRVFYCATTKGHVAHHP